MEPLHLTGTGPKAVNVHPVVLFDVLDQHLRKAPAQDRAIGVLLGSVSGGAMEITNSFGISFTPQRHNQEASVERKSLLEMVSLLRRVNDKERVVGCYSTLPLGPHSSPVDRLMLEFIAHVVQDVCRSPLLLVVDTSLQTSRIPLSAYRWQPNTHLQGLLYVFHPLKVNVVASQEERVGLDAIAKATGAAAVAAGNSTPAATGLISCPSGRAGAAAAAAAGAPSSGAELDGLSGSMRRLKGMLEDTLEYVDDVLAGKVEADDTLGRQIADSLAAVPAVDPAAFEASFSTSVQDLLMVSYLAQITAAQMKLAEKLHTLPTATSRR